MFHALSGYGVPSPPLPHYSNPPLPVYRPFTVPYTLEKPTCHLNQSATDYGTSNQIFLFFTLYKFLLKSFESPILLGESEDQQLSRVTHLLCRTFSLKFRKCGYRISRHFNSCYRKIRLAHKVDGVLSPNGPNFLQYPLSLFCPK